MSHEPIKFNCLLRKLHMGLGLGSLPKEGLWAVNSLPSSQLPLSVPSYLIPRRPPRQTDSTQMHMRISIHMHTHPDLPGGRSLLTRDDCLRVFHTVLEQANFDPRTMLL